METRTIIIILAAVIAISIGAIIVWILVQHNKKGKVVTTSDKNKKRNVIEFADNNDTIFQLIDITSEADKYKNEIELIVPETHFAFIVADGIMSSVLSAGAHRILKKEHRSIKAIYISKTYKLQVRWGTPPNMRIKYVDPKIGVPIDVAAFGRMEFQVAEAKQFYLEIISSFGDKFSIEDLQERVRLKIVDRVTSAVRRMIMSKQLSYYDFDAHKDELQIALIDELRDVIISAVGLRVCDLFVENMNITEENEQKILEKYQKAQDEVEHDEQRRLDKKHEEERREDARSEREWKIETRPWDVQDQNWEYEDIDRANRFNVHQQKDLDIIHDHIKGRERDDIDYERRNRIDDETRQHEWDKEDKDRAAKLAEDAMMYDALKTKFEAEAKAAVASMQPVTNDKGISSVGRHCRMCGSEYGTNDMYCPVCGAVTDRNDVEVTCPKCQKVTTAKNKFCPSCGANLNE